MSNSEPLDPRSALGSAGAGATASAGGSSVWRSGSTGASMSNSEPPEPRSVFGVSPALGLVLGLRRRAVVFGRAVRLGFARRGRTASHRSRGRLGSAALPFSARPGRGRRVFGRAARLALVATEVEERTARRRLSRLRLLLRRLLGRRGVRLVRVVVAGVSNSDEPPDGLGGGADVGGLGDRLGGLGVVAGLGLGLGLAGRCSSGRPPRRGSGAAAGAPTGRRDLALHRRQQHLRDVEDLDLLAGLARRPARRSARRRASPGRTGSRPRSGRRRWPTASVVRLTLIRSPMFSSIHIRAPPAPQQKERSALRSISTYDAPGSTWSSSRGGA